MIITFKILSFIVLLFVVLCLMPRITKIFPRNDKKIYKALFGTRKLRIENRHYITFLRILRRSPLVTFCVALTIIFFVWSPWDVGMMITFKILFFITSLFVVLCLMPRITKIFPRNDKKIYKALFGTRELRIENRHYITFLRILRRSPLVTFCVALTIIIFAWSLYGLLFLLNIDSPNSFGDAYGSINTLFSGFAFVGIIVAIIIQSQELKEQRKELGLTRKELQGQRYELAIQNETALKQRFENTFFNLLSAHRDITEVISFKKDKGKVVFEKLGSLDIDSSFTYELQLNSKKFIEYIEQLNSKKFIEYIERLNSKTLIEDTDPLKGQNEFYKDRQGMIETNFKKYENVRVLDSYFRFLYRIIKFVKQSSLIKEGTADFIDNNHKIQSDYIGILRAQLSPYELVLIFYNGLVSDYRKMKTFIEEFRILDNLRLDLIPCPYDILLYSSKCFDQDQLKNLRNKFQGESLKFFDQWIIGNRIIEFDSSTKKGSIRISQ